MKNIFSSSSAENFRKWVFRYECFILKKKCMKNMFSIKRNSKQKIFSFFVLTIIWTNCATKSCCLMIIDKKSIKNQKEIKRFFNLDFLNCLAVLLPSGGSRASASPHISIYGFSEKFHFYMLKSRFWKFRFFGFFAGISLMNSDMLLTR